MADSKISALAQAAALTGVEALPIVQDGATVKGSVQQLATAITGATGTNGEVVTTSKPRADLTQTWNASGVTFTGIKFNATDTASAAGSLLMDLQVGGVSKFRIDKTGKTSVFGNGAGNVTLIEGYFDSGATRQFYLDSFAQMYFRGGGISFGSTAGASGDMWIQGGNGLIYLKSTGGIGWGAAAASGTIDTTLFRDAANTLAQRNGTNAQTFRLYNTFTDASNYERGFMRWNSNVLEIGNEFAGTGAFRVNRYYLGSSSSASYLTRAASSQHAVFLYNGVQSVAFGAALQSSVQNSANGVLLGGTAEYGIGVISGFSLGTELFIAPSVMLNSNRKGANLNLIGGAASTVGNWNGGDIVVRGGTANGTGAVGNIIMDTLPTANPLVAGALWNNAGVLSVSAG